MINANLYEEYNDLRENLAELLLLKEEIIWFQKMMKSLNFYIKKIWKAL